MTTYAYNTHGAPAVGGGLPGLPQRQSSAGKLERSSFTRIVTPGSGLITPPEGAKFMRVALHGGGGAGFSDAASSARAASGAGGGCTATLIIPAAAVEYEIGVGGTASNSSATLSNGKVSSAKFANYNLVANPGEGGYSKGSVGANVRPVGGDGSGGDFNFKGGDGATTAALNFSAGGAGAAGPDGNGATATIPSGGSSAAPTQGQFANISGWGVFGGSSGGCSNSGASTTCAAGGSGAGAIGAPALSSMTASTFSPGAISLFGKPASAAYGSPTVATAVSDGGEMGGGGAAIKLTSGPVNRMSNGGSGGIVVEWFY